MFQKRYDYEVFARKGIEADHQKYGDTLHRSSRYPIPAAPRANATTARTTSATQFAKIENLYNVMTLSSSHLYIPGMMGSWDSYNQVQNFMSEYIAQFYGLPSMSAANKKQAEQHRSFAAGESRADLEMPLLPEDYNQVKPLLDALQLPSMPAGGIAQLCQQLSGASLQELGR